MLDEVTWIVALGVGDDFVLQCFERLDALPTSSVLNGTIFGESS